MNFVHWDAGPTAGDGTDADVDVWLESLDRVDPREFLLAALAPDNSARAGEKRSPRGRQGYAVGRACLPSSVIPRRARHASCAFELSHGGRPVLARPTDVCSAFYIQCGS